MDINSKHIIDIMENIAPVHLAEKWDNVGYLLGDVDAPVNKIMIALELTEDVLQEAIDECVDLVITHHPLFFKSIKSLTTSSVIGRKVYRLIANKISVYSAHTNLDITWGGTNDFMAEALDLLDISGLSKIDEEHYIGRVGYLASKMRLDEFCELVANSLNTNMIRLVGDRNRLIQKVGLCTGAGMDYAKDALMHDCDVYITGDIKYHQAQDMKEEGMCLIDAGHFPTEYFYVKPMMERLKLICEQKYYNVHIITSKAGKDPFCY